MFLRYFRFDTLPGAVANERTIAERAMAREKGVVKWFSTDKGYGFIRRESGDEIFVHHSDIEVDGYASLKNGETVEFDVFESDRGPKARNLVPTEAGERDAKAEPRSREGRRKTSSRKRSSRSGETTGTDRADGKRPLAELLRERLSGRFPGLGA